MTAWTKLLGDRGLMFAVAVGAISTASLCLLLFQGLTGSPSGGVEIMPAVIDVGDVGEGTHEVSFELANNTPYSIDVDSVSVNCACTDIKIVRGELPSGERRKGSLLWSLDQAEGITGTTFAVQCSTHGRSQDLIPNPDGPKSFLVVGQLRANVKPWWRTEPAEVTFFGGEAQGPNSSAPETTIKIVPEVEPNVRIVSASVASDDFIVRVDPSQNAAILSIRGDSLSRGTMAVLVIKTTSQHREHSNVVIRVR